MCKCRGWSRRTWRTRIGEHTHLPCSMARCFGSHLAAVTTTSASPVGNPDQNGSAKPIGHFAAKQLFSAAGRRCGRCGSRPVVWLFQHVESIQLSYQPALCVDQQKMPRGKIAWWRGHSVCEYTRHHSDYCRGWHQCWLAVALGPDTAGLRQWVSCNVFVMVFVPGRTRRSTPHDIRRAKPAGTLARRHCTTSSCARFWREWLAEKFTSSTDDAVAQATLLLPVSANLCQCQGGCRSLSTPAQPGLALL